MPDSVPGKLVASEPVPPVRQYSFTDFQVNNPTAPPPGDRLDAEFDRINAAIGGTLAWTETSLSPDGTLRARAPNAAPRSISGPENAADHADGAAAVAQAYADVGMAWAEYMPDTIPPNLLVVQAVTGDHWSSRWWAHRASEYIYELEALLRAAPPLAIVYEYTYIATAGQTVFTGADRDGTVLVFTPGPQQTLAVYSNGLLRTPVTDYTATANTVTFLTPRGAGDVVQIQVEGIAAGGGYLPLTGGTLTGPLVLSADPLVALGAATRQYVDNHQPLGGPYLPISGGILTGDLTTGQVLTVQGTSPSPYPQLRLFNSANPVDQKLVVLYSDPSGSLNMQFGNDVGSAASTFFSVSRGSGYAVSAVNLTAPSINLNGTAWTSGTLTGNGVYSNAGFTLNGTTGGLLYDANYCYHRQDSSNWQWRYTRSNGTMEYVRGSDGASLFAIDGGGSVTAPGRATVNSIMNGTGTMYVAGDTAYYMGRNGADGHWRWVENNVTNMELDAAGTLTLKTEVVAPYITASTTVRVGDGQQQMYQPPGVHRYAFNNGWTWDWVTATGDLTWYANTVGAFITFIATGASQFHAVNWLGPWQGQPYITVSDERTKRDIEPSTVGLAEVLKIAPIRFHRPGKARVEIGFSAQQLAAVLPEAVVPVGTPEQEGPGSLASDDPMLGITSETVVAALVNAVRTLSARIEVLEGTRA
jgi:hypothetical protein